MYRYDQYDHLIVRERIAQYRDQVRRRLGDELTEAEFLPLLSRVTQWQIAGQQLELSDSTGAVLARFEVRK